MSESEWTPSTEQVRSHYVFDQSDRWDPERGAAFDRWLAAHDREVKAAAVREAATLLDVAPDDEPDARSTPEWLRDHADLIDLFEALP